MFFISSIAFLNLQAATRAQVNFSAVISCLGMHSCLKQRYVPVLSKRVSLELSIFDSPDPQHLDCLLRFPSAIFTQTQTELDALLLTMGYSSQGAQLVKQAVGKIKKIIFQASTHGVTALLQPKKDQKGFLIEVLDKNIGYFGKKEMNIFLGPILYDVRGDLLDKNWTDQVDGLKIEQDDLVAACVSCIQRGLPRLRLIVIGTKDIGAVAIRKKIDAVVGDEEEFNSAVMDKLGILGQDEKHSALMGGVGLSAGYHYHTKNFIFNVRSGVDHIWGKFRQTGPQNIDTENMPKLGWGVTLGAGVDYKFTEKSTIGLEGGVRLSEFKIPMQDKPTSTKSSWFMAPYAQIVCGFYPTPDYSVSVFTGYFFPRTFAVKAEGTRITEGTKCTVDGIFGGLKFSRYF